MQLDNITEIAGDLRREALLEAAVGVFARYGFRKASMDEVAHAAGVSRQGLYLQFENKEELFRKCVDYRLARQLSAAVAALSNDAVDLQTRLIASCDAWAGRFVGTQGSDAADLMCASTSLAGATLTHYESGFESALARAVDASPLANFCATSGISAHEIARALHATCRGLKHACVSRQEFVRGITVAAQMFCSALSPRIVHEE